MILEITEKEREFLWILCHRVKIFVNDHYLEPYIVRQMRESGEINDLMKKIKEMPDDN
jgi:hypothetical protein